MELGRQRRERMTVEGFGNVFSGCILWWYLPPLASPPSDTFVVSYTWCCVDDR